MGTRRQCHLVRTLGKGRLRLVLTRLVHCTSCLFFLFATLVTPLPGRPILLPPLLPLSAVNTRSSRSPSTHSFQYCYSRFSQGSLNASCVSLQSLASFSSPLAPISLLLQSSRTRNRFPLYVYMYLVVNHGAGLVTLVSEV